MTDEEKRIQIKREAYLKIKKSKSEDRSKQSRKKWRDQNQEKTKTHDTFNYALRSGKLTKKPCAICGKIKVEGHHPDHSKPLEAVFLCKRHHLGWHRFKRQLQRVLDKLNVNLTQPGRR